ncbi:MAG: AfsR/SARP family transcriptional regulator [Acidimicrobiales bacterium]
MPDEQLSGLAREGETLADAVERIARPMVLDSRAESYLPSLPELRELVADGSLDQRPDAQLFVALVANADGPKDVSLINDLIARALNTFTEREDVAGQAVACWVRGNVALGLGDLASASRAWRQAAELDPDAEMVEGLALANLAYGSFCETGDVEESLTLALDAAAASLARADGRAAGLALVYAAYFQILAGRFDHADQELAAAEAAFASEPTSPYEWPLAHAAQGALAAIRGQTAEADAAFERGVRLAREVDNRWYEAIVRTLRADHTVHFDARRAHVDARWALRVFEELGDTWFAATARRVRAEAALESGEVEAARLLAEGLIDHLTNPVERGRCLIVVSRAHLKAGDLEDAAHRADQAIRSLETTGATYLLVTALLLLAESDPMRAPDAIERARGLTTPDQAYTRLWDARPNLRVHVLGRQAVHVGDELVEFRTTKAEQLVLLLAIAGGRGIDNERVGHALWPDGDPAKMPSNLSSAAYDARQALGPEAWRLHRASSQFWLDLDGAFVDLDDAMRRVRHAETEAERNQALADLSQEILPTLVSDRWVREANLQRDAYIAPLLS